MSSEPMTEVLVSYPEELLLAREATSELPETAWVVAELPLDLLTYFRCVAMDGNVHEHAVVFGASTLSAELKARVADILGRRKPTRVTFAEELAPGRYALSAHDAGPRDASALAAAVCSHGGFDGPIVEVAASGRTFRVEAVLQRLFWRCRCSLATRTT